ncbi:hypothetical protein MUB24_17460 [Lederbergia sp. NSJ-179]|uniref:YkoP family protein n=1 Tax=Lederbergia sp. NSJ-179 TaxID=2931402 RepID=UPI001FD14BAB|nr:hypothetical protein [Lederbergia sp. NSJ-179]MCJ7842654.1 hypothetical protein [Lederbergia sp. NSJ-179]
MLIRTFFLTIWTVLDPIYFSCTRLQYICPERKRNGIFRVRLTRYKGKDIVLSDGIKICKNDLMLKIHLYNVRLLQDFSDNKNDLAKGRAVFKQILESMPLLAAYIVNHPEEAKIKGVIGITLINKGYRPLGFECMTPENKFYTWFKKATQIPIYLLSSSKVSIANIKKHHPVYLMMSKDKLFSLYKRPV